MKSSVFVLICIIYALVQATDNIFRFIMIGTHCSEMYEESKGYTYRCQSNESETYGMFNESETFFLLCTRESNFPVDDVLPLNLKSLPKLDREINFQNVNLVNCLPTTSGSYAETFTTMNISNSIDRLELRFERNVSLHPHHLTGLSLQSLAIITDYNYGIHIDLNILESLDDLEQLYLTGMIVPPMPGGNRITSVTLMKGEPARFLQPWGDCTHLEQLSISYWRVDILPDRWLANCSHLHSLHLKKFILLRRLPSRMLEGVHSLQSLTVSGSQLEVLPPDFLSDATKLRFLDLSNNYIVFQPSSGIFSSLSSLEILDLSHNTITISVVTDFAPLVSLQSLSLDYINEADINNFKESALKWSVLPSLKRLSIKHSQITRLWPKWYETMPMLKELDLTGNNITTITYQDMQQIHANGWEVSLRENPLKTILLEQGDYDAALMDNNQGYNVSDQAILWIDSPKHCDCRWYWFMKLLKELPTYVSLPELRCTQIWGKVEDPKPVKNVSLKKMLCQLPESDCTPGCMCFQRKPDNMTFVNCTDAGIKQIPKIHNLQELHLASNHIATLQAANLPDTLTFLDLKNNRLARLDAETMEKMFTTGSRTYNLAGNPFICDCSNRAMVEALHRYSNLVIDYENVTCVNKQTLGDVDINKLCLAEEVTLIASVIGTLAVLMVILFAVYYRYRREVHVILRSWGYTTSCCINEKELDCDKTYDVFISFAYGDTTFITDELVPKLEKNPFNLSVCVHYRDWIVGDWIPMQIARSVEESRHTMIVLSENFLSSIWAPVEFRTAYKKALKDRSSRLVIILLEDVIGDHRIDQELQAYLVTNTYIKRDDPRFWEKLQLALPRHQCPRRKRCKDRAAGEEVVQLIRVTDPPIKLRNNCDQQVACNDINMNENVTSNGFSNQHYTARTKNM